MEDWKKELEDLLKNRQQEKEEQKKNSKVDDAAI